MNLIHMFLFYFLHKFTNTHDDDFGAESINSLRWYKPPTLPTDTYLVETFDYDTHDDFINKWVLSKAKKDFIEESIAKYDGLWNIEEPKTKLYLGDIGLVLKLKAKHHAISRQLKTVFVFNHDSFILQFEVNMQEGMTCGGAYVKLLMQTLPMDLSQFNDQTPYVIMFGPDKCGNDMKIHFIFRHKNPITQKFEEKHLKSVSPMQLENVFTDKMTHLYRLELHKDNSFLILVDGQLFLRGSLLSDMEPPVNPDKEIIDTNDTKPLDWDDRLRIPDPNSVKPSNWDAENGEYIIDINAPIPEGWLVNENELIPDPMALKPQDWDESIDGTWEAPLIINPACEIAVGCGEWIAPLVKNKNYKGPWSQKIIDNPNYKGPWTPRRIANPNYFHDELPYKMSPIGALGIELWSMTADILFDNFLLTSNRLAADSWTNQTWRPKQQVELLMHKSQVNFVELVVEAAYEKPWLWIIIILVMVIPILIFIVCCCGTPIKELEEMKFEGRDEQSKLSSNDTNVDKISLRSKRTEKTQNLRQRSSTIKK